MILNHDNNAPDDSNDLTELDSMFMPEDEALLENEALGSEQEFSLEGLLSEAMQDVNEAKRMKEARQKMLRGGMSPAQKLQLEQDLIKYELIKMWDVQAYSALFHTQLCQCCGSRNRHFLGYFQRQQHRSSMIDRWVIAGIEHLSAHKYPKEVKETLEVLPTCHTCAVVDGWGKQA